MISQSLPDPEDRKSRRLGCCPLESENRAVTFFFLALCSAYALDYSIFRRGRGSDGEAME